MKKLISIVIPVYNEEKCLLPLYDALVSLFQSMSAYDFEVIFVNDGSKDNSILELVKLSERDHRIKAIDFSRNFGKELALTAGCHYAKGQAVVTMDADLQHPLALIADFLKKWEEGYEVVYTVRLENKGASIIKKMTSQAYWYFFKKISSIDTEPHSTDFRLMDRKVVDIFNSFPERARIFKGIIDWIGFKRAKIEFIAPKRNAGKATYSYNKLVELAINSITSFSLLPLRLAGYLGVMISILSTLLLFIMVVTRWFVDGAFFSAIAFVIVANTWLMGIVLVCLGFIALYIARIHEEVVERPLYLIRNKINIEEDK